MAIPEPCIDPEDLPELRSEIEAMRADPQRFMQLRGTTLQLLDDLTAAYRRLAVMYERADAVDVGEQRADAGMLDLSEAEMFFVLGCLSYTSPATLRLALNHVQRQRAANGGRG
jgi:hypothetical protein